ncbi:5225_t:CDS:2, partial [Entrophospora sp. SA101]
LKPGFSCEEQHILEVTNELLKDVDFQPFMVTLENINIFIFAIGSGWNANWDGVGEGFCSSFTSRFKSESCHFVQKIIKNNCIIEIYKGNECIANFNGATPTEVWKKTGVLKKYKDNLKKKIGVSGLNWYSIFDSFYEQKSSIIELTSSLKKIYPQEHEFTSRELRAWHTMMSRVGCHDVTPYPKENSKIAHAIKRYIRIGFDLNSGADIENSSKGVRGTRIANLQPNRMEHVNVKTLSGVSNWFNWRWPKDGDLAGYIQVQELPYIGQWKDISPTQISKLMKASIQKPTPTNTPHSIPKTIWTMPQLRNPQNY